MNFGLKLELKLIQPYGKLRGGVDGLENERLSDDLDHTMA